MTQSNADLIKILEAKLAEARAGQVTDLVGVFSGPPGGTGGQVLSVLDDATIPVLLGNLEIFKPQVIGLFYQRMQQKARGVVPVRNIVDQAAADALIRKLNGGLP